MSTPPFVALPPGVERVTFTGEFGDLAGLIAQPAGDCLGTALLIPGFTGSKEDFIAALPILRDAGWRVVSFDLRGQYESAGPDTPDGYEMASFVSDCQWVLRWLVTEFKHPVHVVGHSFGGLVAQALIEADASDVASLTLLSTGPGPVPGDLQELCRQLIEAIPLVPLGLLYDQKEAADRESRGAQPVLSADLELFLRGRFIRNNPLHLIGAAKLLISVPDSVDQLAAITADRDIPVLVAYGENDDRWTPAEQADMAHRLRARRFVWPQTGHSPPAEHPAWFAGVMAGFWSDVAGTTPNVVFGATKNPWPAGVSLDSAGYTAGMELRSPVETSPRAVGQARRMIARQLQAWGIDSRIDDLEIVASELVTNAVRYGAGPIEIHLVIGDGAIRLEVSDHAESLPLQREAADDEFGGRGMPLIEAISTHWGIEEFTGGKTVWAELSL